MYMRPWCASSCLQHISHASFNLLADKPPDGCVLRLYSAIRLNLLCSPSTTLPQMLVDEGCGLDCSSTSELHIAKKLGIPGESVMYTSNYTSVEDLGIAFDMGM